MQVQIDVADIEEREADDRGRVRLGPDYAGKTVQVGVVSVVGDDSVDTIEDVEATEPEEWRLINPREWTKRTVYQHDSGVSIETRRRQPGWEIRMKATAKPSAETIDRWECSDRNAAMEWFEDNLGGAPDKVHNK